jgi:hypothetical protein
MKAIRRKKFQIFFKDIYKIHKHFHESNQMQSPALELAFLHMHVIFSCLLKPS